MTTDAEGVGKAKTYSEAELQEHVKKATAKVHQENALLTKRLKELGDEVESATTENQRLTNEIATVRKASTLSEDTEAFVKYEAETRAALASERRKLDADYRGIRVASLIKEFPTLTEAELSGFKTPYEMEIYALRNHSKAEAQPPAPTQEPVADAASAPTQQQSEPTPQVDRGGAGNATRGTGAGSLRGQDKIAEALANMKDPLGVLPQ